MGKEISLFSGYDQSENRTTNYCLLVLRMLYQENPKLLSIVLPGLFGEQSGIQVGIQFRQQISRGDAVPDGMLSQSAFTIYIETKNSDWFYDEQLERHLVALDAEPQGVKILLALAKFEGEYKSRFTSIEEVCKNKYQQRIFFTATTFDEFLKSLQSLPLSVSLSEVVSEFQQYLHGENLLPNWRGYIDICNCAREVDRLIEAETYICPATGGAYSHQRCEYLGMYWEKGVWRIAKVRGVVDVYPNETPDFEWQTEILWNNEANDGLTNEALSDLARQKFRAAYGQNANWDARVFVLGTLYDTEFVKDSPGGMRGKRYLCVGIDKSESVAEVAQRLKGAVWSKFED